MNSLKTYSISLIFNNSSSQILSELINKCAKITGNTYKVQNEIPSHITLGMFKAPEKQKNELIDLVNYLNTNFKDNFLPADGFIPNKSLESLKNKILYLSFPLSMNNKPLYQFNYLIHSYLLKDFLPANNNLYLPLNFLAHSTIATGLSLSQIKKIKNSEEDFLLPEKLYGEKLSLTIQKTHQILV